MRIIPKKKYRGKPCSFVGTGCAYEDISNEKFNEPLPSGLRSDGWASFKILNQYIRQHLPIRKQVYYRRGERPKLKDFLENNDTRAGVCVYGHFIYVNKSDYWSFFNNENDDIVCIWYIAS